MQEGMKDVFIVGLDDFNGELLPTVRDANRMRFHRLFSTDEVVAAEHYRVREWVEEGVERLRRFPGTVDALVGWWDFPTSNMLPLMRRPLGLPGPSLESVLRCEHKFWSRLEQKKCVPECTPAFAAFDPFGEDPRGQVPMRPPFWIKPVRAHSSNLGFRIGSEEDFRHALPRIREGIGRFGEPFDWILEQAELPSELGGVGGHHCVAEEIISAEHQCTLEGYCFQGEVHVYGVVDSIREGRHRSSFSRYEYPSRLPEAVQQRMVEAATRFVRHVGLDDTAWNMEFYYDPDRDEIKLLEVNTRISQSHCALFWLVDGRSNQEVMVDVGLGRRPDFPHREGRYPRAAKFMVRVSRDELGGHGQRGGDGIVRRVPTAEDLERVRQIVPGTRVKVGVEEGQRLGAMRHQDSYSYELAVVFLGGESDEELAEHYETALGILDFRIDPVDPEGSVEPSGPVGGPETQEQPAP